MTGARFLSGATILNKFEHLAANADHIEVAVAWGTAKHPAHRALMRVAERVKTLVVGLHFHQTDPRFIREWWSLVDSPLRVVLDTKGIFHPKIYLFQKGKRAWLMLGSANLTNAAFSRNTEAMLLIETSTSDPIIADACAAIRAQHREVKISEAWLAKYTAAWL